MSLRKSAAQSSTPSVGRKLAKKIAIPLAFHGSRFLMHLPLTSARKLQIWESFVGRYMSWRTNAFWIRTRFGARVFCSLGDLIQCRLIYFGIWEPNLTGFVQRRLQTGDTFVDVGANIGYYSLLASKSVGTKGRVVAIEASPKIFMALQKNLGANKCDNVRAVNVAISDRKGVLRLFSGPSSNIGMTSTMKSRGQDFESEVPANRLDAVLLPEELKAARLIKIDVEGAEAPVLISILENIDRYRQDLEIMVEINPPEVQEHGLSVADILNRFAEVGYHAYLLDNDYSPAAYVGYQPTPRPKRLRHLPTGLTDVVFSRVNANEL